MTVEPAADARPPEFPPMAAVASPELVGQATAIEQSRAVAEVQAAIIVAQRVPRNVGTAMALMRESCTQQALADRAFFRYSRAGSAVTGPTVHLARELARCWGNVQYNVIELRRDPGRRESEMQAFAWDVQVNVRSALTFVVPHKRDTRQGTKDLADMRDIYENNANMGARRLREAIFSVLPTWFVQQAVDLCTQTVAAGGGDKPLGQQIADAIDRYADLHVTRGQLEEKLARPSGQWQPTDLAMLRVIYTSLRRGEISKDEEFPPPRVTAEEVLGTGRRYDQGRRGGPDAGAGPSPRAGGTSDPVAAPADPPVPPGAGDDQAADAEQGPPPFSRQQGTLEDYDPRDDA